MGVVTSNDIFLSYKKKRYIENRARALQKEMWIKAGRPRNFMSLFSPEKTAVYLGYEYKEFENLNDPKNPKDTNTAGIIDPVNKIILISLQFTKEIRLYTAAHEIGHAVLHSGKTFHRDRAKNGIEFSRDSNEREADYFAACLLMPRKAVIYAYKARFGTFPLAINNKTASLLNPKNPSSVLKAPKVDLGKYLSSVTSFNYKKFESISKVFGVSNPAMAYRLNELVSDFNREKSIDQKIQIQNTVRDRAPKKEPKTYPKKSILRNENYQPLVKIGELMPGAESIRKRGERRKTWKGNLRYSNGSETIAYVKDIDPQQIARELLSAVLAKELGLPITQACLVKIKPKVLPKNSHNKYIFGLEDAKSLPILNRDFLRTKIVEWPLFLLCIVFDSWIGNTDRVPNNLLYSNDSNFYLIDHGEALDLNILGEDTSTQNDLIQLYKEHSGFDPRFLLSHLIEESKNLNKIDFEKVRREIIFSNKVVLSEHIDPLINLLKKRLEHLPSIIDSQIGN